jgi:hypothetical protein
MMKLLNTLTARLNKQTSTFSPAQCHLVERAYQKFAHDHPCWAQSLFDLMFLNGGGAPIVQGYLDGTNRDAGEALARAYLDEIQFPASRRSEAIASVLPAARSFLRQLAGSVHRPSTATMLPARQV